MATSHHIIMFLLIVVVAFTACSRYNSQGDHEETPSLDGDIVHQPIPDGDEPDGNEDTGEGLEAEDGDAKENEDCGYICPAHSHPKTNCDGCDCDEDFTRQNGICTCSLPCQDNAHPNDDCDACECDENFVNLSVKRVTALWTALVKANRMRPAQPAFAPSPAKTTLIQTTTVMLVNAMKALNSLVGTVSSQRRVV